MYENQSTLASPVGVDVFTSSTGVDGSWKKTNYIENLNATLDNVKRDSHLIDGTDGRRWYNDIDLGEITSDSYIRLGIRGVEPWLNTISIEEAEFLIIL